MLLPSLVEIEINSDCNLSCSYCPNSVAERVEKGEMSEDLFTDLLYQLRKYDYRGRISFEFYNEPLMAKKIDFFIMKLKEILPDTTLHLYTNAIYLTSAGVLERYLDKGVDRFIITKHEQVKNLPIEKFLNELNDSVRSTISFQEHDDIKKSNRAGCVKAGDLKNSFIDSKCSVPANILTISVKGNVISCFEDFYQKYNFGNTRDKNVIEIWNSPEYMKFRNDLLAGKRTSYETCSKCNREDRSLGNKNKHLLNEEEIEAMADVIKSGKLFRYAQGNDECSLCEKEFSEYFGSKHSFLLTSGTNALVASLMAAGISFGDEVIIPAYTFVATAGSVLSVGAIPVVVDIDSDLCISTHEIRKKITERTKAIIPVHMDGIQCKMDEIMPLAREHGLLVIEDVAQAMGASYKGKKLGTWGDVGCYSFNRDKTLTAGEGGLIITSDEHLAKRILSSIDQAISFNPSYSDELKGITPFLGISTRVSEITGAMLRVQLRKLDKIIEENRKRKEIYNDLLKNVDGISIIDPNDQEECHSVFHFKFENAIMASQFSKKLLRQNIMAIPLALRRAHCVWKWSSLLQPGRSFSPKMDPYLNTDIKYNYNKINYLNAIDILMSTLKIDIDITKTEDEVRREAILIAKLLKD